MRTDLNIIYSKLKITPSGNKWELLESFAYYRKKEDEVIFIPKGFTFDGASIPRIFHIIGTPMGMDTLIAALIHDYLVSTKQYTLSKTNAIFNEVMYVCRVNIIKRNTYYIGVILGCWVIWYLK